MEIINVENLNLIEEEIQSIKLIEDDTYDIEVEDVHHYILDNGIVSHNTGIYAGVVSGGIEPVFMKQYTRWAIVVDNEKIKLINKGIEFPDTTKKEWFETKDFKFAKKGDEQILCGEVDNIRYEIDKNRGLTKATDVIDYGYEWAQNKLSLERLREIEPKMATTTELSVEDHINVLNIVSHYTDMNSSKCIEKSTSMIIINDKIMYLDELKFNNEKEFKFVGDNNLHTANHLGEKVKIKSTYNNEANAKCIKVSFDDNSTLTGTLNHKIFVEDSYWIKLIDAKIGQNIVISDKKKKMLCS